MKTRIDLLFLNINTNYLSVDYKCKSVNWNIKVFIFSLQNKSTFVYLIYILIFSQIGTQIKLNELSNRMMKLLPKDRQFTFKTLDEFK